jgi:hypothetical protein
LAAPATAFLATVAVMAVRCTVQHHDGGARNERRRAREKSEGPCGSRL